MKDDILRGWHYRNWRWGLRTKPGWETNVEINEESYFVFCGGVVLVENLCFEEHSQMEAVNYFYGVNVKEIPFKT